MIKQPPEKMERLKNFVWDFVSRMNIMKRNTTEVGKPEELVPAKQEPGPTPNEFYQKLAQKPGVRELLRRLARK